MIDTASGGKIGTTKGISILIIVVGLLLPVASLGFVQGYNPNLGFVGSLPRMKMVFFEVQFDIPTPGERDFDEKLRRAREEMKAIYIPYRA